MLIRQDLHLIEDQLPVIFCCQHPKIRGSREQVVFCYDYMLSVEIMFSLVEVEGKSIKGA